MQYLKMRIIKIKDFVYMKFISCFQKERLRRLTKKRTRKKLKRNNHKPFSEYRQKSEHEKKLNAYKRLDYSEIIKAPPNLDFRVAPEEAINFFEKIRRTIDHSIPIYLDLSEVINLSGHALLYLIAIMQNYKTMGRVFSIGGNTPLEPKSKALFESSGFYRYVRQSRLNLRLQSEDVMRITSGVDHDPLVLRKLCKFIQEKLHVDRVHTQSIFAVVGEMMNNTKSHAYSPRCIVDNWFLFANFCKENNVIDIAFLDTGKGIPQTAKKNFSDYIPFSSHDYQIIESGLNGDFRTSTKKPWRSKGLPDVKQKYENGTLDSLVIVSGRGYINYPEKRNLGKNFNGTLYFWRAKP